MRNIHSMRLIKQSQDLQLSVFQNKCILKDKRVILSRYATEGWVESFLQRGHI